jgi:DNA-binding CsgD family transcriptional regulator/N-acetylneuraminic acid mutarotase
MNESNELSDRELEILKLVATGASNKEIAQKLSITLNTVKVHLRNIFAKIGVASRTEAAMYAVHIGLVAGDVSALNLAAADESNGIEADGYSAVPARVGRNLVMVGLLALVVLIGVGVGLWALGRRSVQGQGTGNGSEAIPTAVERNRWQTHAQMPNARYGFGAAAFDNKIYVIAGTTNQGVTGSVERYDPALDAWISLRSKPTPVGDVEAAVIGGKIYLPGGQLANGEATAILEIYDIGQDQWVSGAPMPVASSASAVVAYEGRLYVFGGWDGRDYFDLALEYNPGNDQWKELPSMPTRRAYAGAAVAGGKIYVIGGRNQGGDLDVNETFSPSAGPQSEAWSSGAPMPVRRASMGLASVADTIHVVGGSGEGDLAQATLVYLPSANKWTRLDNLLALNTANLRLVPLETIVYVLGGEAQKTAQVQNISYQAFFTIVIPLVR